MKPTITTVSDAPPSLLDAQKIVGGYVALICLRDGRQMLVNEEGLRKNLPVNEEAQRIVREQTDLEDEPIVGNVLILEGKALWR